MDKYLNDMFQSGRRLLIDTKTPKNAKTKSEMVKGKPESPLTQDPHKSFQKRCITDKPPKKEVVEYFKKFIEDAESKL